MNSDWFAGAVSETASWISVSIPVMKEFSNGNLPSSWLHLVCMSNISVIYFGLKGSFHFNSNEEKVFAVSAIP